MSNFMVVKDSQFTRTRLCNLLGHHIKNYSYNSSGITTNDYPPTNLGGFNFLNAEEFATSLHDFFANLTDRDYRNEEWTAPNTQDDLPVETKLIRPPLELAIGGDWFEIGFPAALCTPKIHIHTSNHEFLKEYYNSLPSENCERGMIDGQRHDYRHPIVQFISHYSSRPQDVILHPIELWQRWA